MGRELNIQSDEAFDLASTLAEQQGKSIAEVVEDALRAYRNAVETPEQRLERWQKLLEEDRKNLNDSDFTIEDLYDPETGLPA